MAIGLMPLLGADQGDAIASGAQPWLAGVWFTRDGANTSDLVAVVAGGEGEAPHTYVVFPVTDAVAGASVPLYTESAGGVLPDPAPESPHTGTGFWATAPDVIAMLMGAIAVPAGSVIESVDGDGRRRVFGRVR